jgi:uncharacterized membrane protein
MNQRPKLKIPMDRIDLYLEITAIMLLLFCVFTTLIIWSQLPERVPIHFNITGQADRYGSKASFLIILPVLLFLYLAFTILGKFPHIYNYVVKITKKNAEKQYRLAKRLISVLKNEIIIIFIIIQQSILSAAKSGVFPLKMNIGPIILIIILGTVAYYIAESYKAR